MRKNTKFNLGLVVLLLGLSFIVSMPVSAQQSSELIFPLFKYSDEEQAFWTILGIKANAFVPIVDNIDLEASKTFIVYGFTKEVANMTIKIEVFDYYEKYVDELGVERVNSSLAGEPSIYESYHKIVHPIPIQLSESDVFKVVRISAGSSYFMFQYKTVWDYRTTIWTNIDFFLQVQLVNWLIILFVAFIAMGVAIAFVTKADCIPPFSYNPIPQFCIIGVGLMLMGLGVVVRPPELFAVTSGIFSIILIVGMQLWSLKADVKEATTLDTNNDKPVIIDVIEKGGDVQYIDRASWIDTVLRVFGIYHIIKDFHIFKRPTGEGATSDYLLYGVFTKPKVEIVWKGLKPTLQITPAKIEYYSKSSVRLISKAVVEELSQEKIKIDLKDTAEVFKGAIEKLNTTLDKEPFLYRLSLKRNFLNKIPLVRRFVAYIPHAELERLLILRQDCVNAVREAERLLDEKIQEFRFIHEKKHDLRRELQTLGKAGQEIEQKEEQIAILEEQMQLKGAEWVKKSLERWSRQLRGDFEIDKELDALFDKKKKVRVSKEEIKDVLPKGS